MRILIAVLLFCTVAAAQLPDAPQPQPKAPSFFSYMPATHVYRTNRETLGSPWYLGPAAAAWASGVAVYRVNRANGATKRDVFVPLIAISGMAYPMDRWVWRPISVGMFGYVTQKYARGAIGHYYP